MEPNNSPATALKDLTSADHEIRRRAIDRVRQARVVDALDPLVKLLRDERRDIRKSAAAALGTLGDRRALEPLVEALQDTERAIQVDAIEALGALEAREAVPPLVEALEDVRLRAAIPPALARIGDASVSPHLVELLREDPNQHVRRNAARALGDMRCSDAIPALLIGMIDEEHGVREASHNALRKLEEERVRELGPPTVAQLLEGLQSENWMIRATASNALGQVASSDSFDGLVALARQERSAGVLTQVGDALGLLGDARAVPVLIPFLDDKGWDVRCSAIQAMGRLRRPETYKLVLRALKDREGGVRRAAIRALASYGDASSSRKIRKLLQDRVGAVRCAAADALGSLKDTGAVRHLEALTEDPDVEIRQAARAALAKIRE